MKFSDFVEIYLNDIKNTWKPTTYHTSISKIQKWLIPYFGDKPLNDISVLDIRNWQNLQRSSGLAVSSQNKNQKLLSGIFNYAVKYYDLPENPCLKAGPLGSTKSKEFDF